MKRIFLLSTLLTLNTFACPNFTGSYRINLDMNTQAIQTVNQVGCNFIKVNILDKATRKERLEFLWTLDGSYQESPFKKDQYISGEMDEEVFYWKVKDIEGNVLQESWDIILENGNIERFTLVKLLSGQTISTVNIIQRIPDM